MSEVETVALWLGLIAAVVSTVLAIVAIRFTYAVDRRSTEVNEQMIKSLQKIESSVERIASDTAELIKVAWDRLLPDPSGKAAEDGAELQSLQSVTQGAVAEFRKSLASGEVGLDAEVIDRLNNAIAQLDRTLSSHLASLESNKTSRIDGLRRAMSAVSAEARELLRNLAEGSHLEEEEYARLIETRLSVPLLELRRAGLIVPLMGIHHETGEEAPVYWLPPGTSEYVRPLLAMVSTPRETATDVRRVLHQIGYLDRVEDLTA